MCHPVPVSHDDLARDLSALLGATQVSDLRRLSGGASRETWQFRADDRPLILQRQRTGDVRDMAAEFAVLRAARANGVRVPEVIQASADPSVLGAAFMVLSHVVFPLPPVTSGDV